MSWGEFLIKENLKWPPPICADGGHIGFLPKGTIKC